MSAKFFKGNAALILAFALLIQGCKKDDGDAGELPQIQTIEINSLTHSSARSGGEIIHNGEGQIFRKGICWGLNSSPNIDSDSVLQDNSTALEFEAVLHKLTSNTTYYIRAFATNINGVAYGQEKSFTTTSVPQYSVGDIGPAGGFVFYDKREYSDSWQYLESAPAAWHEGNEEDPEAKWGCFRTFLRADNTAIGAGEFNTLTILEECGELSTAAKLCDQYSVNHNGIIYSDWFLPSKDELNEMYEVLKLNNLGGFQDSYYWSSSEMTALIAWLQGYDNGLQYKSLFRINEVKVRPIRAF